MDVTRSEFQDLVGAYALDACEPEEVAALDLYVAAHAEAAAETERLRDAAAWLGAVGALNPPVTLRDRLLVAAAERPDPLPPVDALRRETDRFEALLDSLSPTDLGAVTYNGLTVRDLVAHIAIVDEAFVAEAPLDETHVSTWSFIGADAVAQMTGVQLPEMADWSFAEIRDRWQRARRALIELESQLAPVTRFAGYSLPSVLVIRAFETWTHHGDIASVLGRVEIPADPPALRTMAELAVKTLPLALAARGYEFPGRTARVVMGGPGGGDWTIACSAQEADPPFPDVILRVPLNEFCLRFADRLAVDDVPFEVEGDAALGRALVDAAPAFAGL